MSTYFSNGSQYRAFECHNCFDCLNYRSVENKKPCCNCKDNDGETGFGCVITDMFSLFQDKMTEEMRNLLIKDYECPMRLTADDAELRLNDVFERIAMENNQLREGLIQGKIFEENNKLAREFWKIINDPYFRGLGFDNVLELAKKSIRLTDENCEMRHKIENVTEILDDTPLAIKIKTILDK